MLSKKQEKYVSEVGSTILKQLKKSNYFRFWGMEEGGVVYAPYYIKGEQLKGALIFYISTEKYEDMHYVRVIYEKGSDSYTVQVLVDNRGLGKFVDMEVIEEIKNVYAFGLAQLIDQLI